MFDALIGPVTSLLTTVFDRIVPDPAQAADMKLKMLQLVQDGSLKQMMAETDITKAAASIIQTEAASSNWLASSWRPITMLVFVALIVARWFGWAAPNLQEAEYLKLWDIVQLGLGGYVIGRSAEKIIPSVATAFKGINAGQ